MNRTWNLPIPHCFSASPASRCAWRAALAAIALAPMSPGASAAPSEYRFDPIHTQVLFSVDHLGFSHPVGRLHVKGGYLRFDEDDWSTAAVEVEVDAASVDMGDADWNEKVRSRQFLAAERHPGLRFVSTRVEKTGPRKGIVHGKLTLLGVTRPLDLEIGLNRVGVDVYTFQRTAGFSATARIKRSDFGMDRYLKEIGDQVDVRVEVEAVRDAKAHESIPNNPGETAVPTPPAKEN